MKITIVGCGVMGSALARHLAKHHRLTLCDSNQVRTEALAKEIGGEYLGSLREAVQRAEVVVLAVKPKDLLSVGKSIAEAVTKEKILLSILAGTPLALLRQVFPAGYLVRAMPNLGFISGQGVTGLVDDGALSQKVKGIIDTLMEGMGLSIWMTENKIEAVTALSGSGIAFDLFLIEAMIDGGVKLGFTEEEAKAVVLKTMEGAVALLKQTGRSPQELRQQISSPGGTTLAGLKVMEEKGVRDGILQTLYACHERALSMMK
jgi:pyrroline-5-carboxylate reductase